MRHVAAIEPDIVGTRARAWRYTDEDTDHFIRRSDPRRKTTVGSWIVYAPWAHPFWSYHWIGLCHFREVEGAPPPIIDKKGATHNLLVYSLHPNFPPMLDEHPHLLQPAAIDEQFAAMSDEVAKERVESAIRDITEGLLSPDVDFRRMWAMRFE